MFCFISIQTNKSNKLPWKMYGENYCYTTTCIWVCGTSQSVGQGTRGILKIYRHISSYFENHIRHGFNRKESTLEVVEDIQKAYDSVWREGLLFKLHKKEIQGKIWF